MSLLRPGTLLQASTALRLRAATRPHSVVLTDIHGDLSARDLLGLAQLMSGRGGHRPALAELPPQAPLREVLLTALAGDGNLDLRSNGTTGPPRIQRRGPLTPAQLRTLADLARRIGLRAGARVATAAPGVQGHGLLVALGALSLGAPLVDLTHLPATERITVLHRSAPRVLTGMPVHLSDLLRADQELGGNRPLRIRRVVSGSDVLTDELRADLARRWGARVHDVYGTVEAGSLTVDGRPLKGVRIREREGLLHTRTPFTAGREVITDRGTVDAKGLVTVTGRVDGAVSSGGMLHEPRAVARLIASAPGVASVRLRVVTDEQRGRRTVAEVTLAEDASAAVNSDGLRALVRDRLGAASVPREVHLSSRGR